ncbi:polysulfide reductase [Streptomyces kaempferi]
MVPRAEFRSYYGRPVLKPPVWEWKIPAYLFTGGLSAGAALLAAGADLTARPRLRRAGRVGGFAALLVSMYLLVADLGLARAVPPHDEGRQAELTDVRGHLDPHRLRARQRAGGHGRDAARNLARHDAGAAAASGGPSGRLSAALFAPGVASYTAVLLSQTAVPAWHDARSELPFVFTGSAAASAGGLGMVLVPVTEAGPARRFAAVGAAAEIVAARLIDRRPGFVTRAYTTGHPHHLRRASEFLTLAGAVTALTLARRSRAAAAVGGLALMAGSVLQRFGTFEAGVTSTKDPAYVVKPQRERLDARREERDGE